MAERTITLTMKPAEEAALARLLAHVCNQHIKPGLFAQSGFSDEEIHHVGVLNGALNAIR